MRSLILNGSVRLTVQAQSMAQLAEALSMQLDRGAEDLTGLHALYDFHLSYTPESVLANLPVGPDGATGVQTRIAQGTGAQFLSKDRHLVR
jgi:uncharacterized protein (TIGR03435 family)